MAWPLVCFLLLTCCSGSFFQPVLTQSRSMSVSPGATARLTCTLSSQHSDYGIEWFQQSPGKAPRLVMQVETDGPVDMGEGETDGPVDMGEGIPDHFSGSSSGMDLYLSISNIEPEDEADYYCGTLYGSGSRYGYHSTTFSEQVGQKPAGQPSPSPGC